MLTIAFNPHCQRFYEDFPAALRIVIESQQAHIDRIMQSLSPGIIPTSGFRCPRCNRQWGGKQTSLHLWGLARDYRLSSWNGKRPHSAELLLIPEPHHGCLHVQIKLS